jgi:hypothetical protein
MRQTVATAVFAPASRPRPPRARSAAPWRQPADALDPAAFFIAAAEAWALERSSRLAADLFRLTAFWHIDLVRQHVAGERNTRYVMKLAQSVKYGIACAPGRLRPNVHADLMGQDAREVLRNGTSLDDVDRAALIDLVIGHVPAPGTREITLDQAPAAKYAARSRIFADEAEWILRHKGAPGLKGRNPRVLVIGATAGMIGALMACGTDVCASDMSPDIIGRNLGGVIVQSGLSANPRLMKAVDLAIITGLTFTNQTLPSLMRLARKHNTSTMIWAITGRNLGPYYTENGVDCVVSDPSPFLTLPGAQTVAITRRKN